MTDAATKAQNAAAHPQASTWLTANAGSGKTRVLTNRVARLLLNGVEPQNILCLTYTKAAASEMQNRLFRTLGTWAMLPEDKLRGELVSLGETPPNDLSHARTLFASAIEAPGGLKIQTIHSFCSKVLRQFPLEAGVNPQFREMDERAQREVLTDVIDEIARIEPDVITNVRRAYSGDSLTDLARDISKNTDEFAAPRSKADIYAAFGVPSGQAYENIVANAVTSSDVVFLKRLAPILREQGGTNDGKLADALAALADVPTLATLIDLENLLLTKEGATEPFSFKRNIPTKDVRNGASFSPLVPEFVAIGERVETARRARVALDAAEHTFALDAFAQAILPRYARAKAASGLLDFDDLIRLTKRLLTSRSLEWVLYRLDSRIDHVLVDEAQDTSPMQWDVIEALTAEMVSGESDRNRTLFVVGDKKQSIYSFQGADTEGFDRRADMFHDKLDARSGMERHELRHSFRSSPAILAAVDAVFSKDSGAGEATHHLAFHDMMPGRVDHWPLLERPNESTFPPWYDLSARTVESDASSQLATLIAEEISSLLKTGTIQGKNGKWRKVRAGDIMVLVQRRSSLFDQIIAACKRLNLDIAGADRLKVGSELAVRDVLALLSFLALPEDDLSLAAALRSPLLGWTEQDLFDLAARRPERTYLWQALRDRRDDFPETHSLLTKLRKDVDFLRPFELIDHILTEHDGRRKLLARLGPEAEDGIDELLNQALAYERTNTPSLTGFLAYARASDIEVRREADAGGSLIRVMTVHGAKGLESPIVILPDTTFSKPRSGQEILKGPEGLPVLPLGKAKSPDSLQDAKAAKQRAEDAERDRLLYVAMTRAERWLIVCGVQPAQTSSERLNWHQKVATGLSSLPVETLETPTGQGLRFSVGKWADSAENTYLETESDTFAAAIVELGIIRAAPQTKLLNPSDMGGAKVLDGEPEGVSGGARKGRQLHLLLEVLPGANDPGSVARRVLADSPDPASEDEVAGLLEEAQRIIASHPDIFGPSSLAEVEIVADISARKQRVSGAIDRLVVGEDRVLAVDFKTNASIPKAPEDVPEGLLRQMGAYLEALESVYPNRKIDLAILWTVTGALMPLPHGIVREALQRSTTS